MEWQKVFKGFWLDISWRSVLTVSTWHLKWLEYGDLWEFWFLGDKPLKISVILICKWSMQAIEGEWGSIKSLNKQQVEF
jgi:hypothetical protein